MVKRLSFYVAYHDLSPYAAYTATDDGDWVAHSDYATLEADNASLREQKAEEYARHIAFITAVRQQAGVGAGPEVHDLPHVIGAKIATLVEQVERLTAEVREAVEISHGWEDYGHRMSDRATAAEAQLAEQKAENERLKASCVTAWAVTDDDGKISAITADRDDASAAASALGMDQDHVVPVEIRRALKPTDDGRV